MMSQATTQGDEASASDTNPAPFTCSFLQQRDLRHDHEIRREVRVTCFCVVIQNREGRVRSRVR